MTTEELAEYALASSNKAETAAGLVAKAQDLAVAHSFGDEAHANLRTARDLVGELLERDDELSGIPPVRVVRTEISAGPAPVSRYVEGQMPVRELAERAMLALADPEVKAGRILETNDVWTARSLGSQASTEAGRVADYLLATLEHLRTPERNLLLRLEEGDVRWVTATQLGPPPERTSLVSGLRARRGASPTPVDSDVEGR